MTGESPPRSAKATAAPHAPVPEDCVSPTPRSKIRARIVLGPVAVQNETFVRFGKRGSCSTGGPSTREVERLELGDVGDPDRALRVADRDVLEAAAADLAGAVGVADG